MISHEELTSLTAQNATAPAGNRRRIRVLLLLLLMAGALYSWGHKPVPMLPSAPLVTKQVLLPAGSNQFRTEEEWMASDIVNAIAEMIAFAATGKTPAEAGVAVRSSKGARAQEYIFEASVGEHSAPARTQLVLTNYFWAPENFVTLAKGLASKWSPNVVRPRSPVDREIFLRLTTPSPDALVREDLRISEALTKSPLDAEMHEEAALLIGSFALRHAADTFYDVRRELSRMTAHLAIARASGEESGPCADLAEAILCSLAGRQTGALEIMQRLERHADASAGLPLVAQTIWNRAITLRNTGDYRKLDQPEHATLLERLEYVNALRYRIDSAAASAFLVRHPAENLAEWSNVILAGNFSVSEGHLWAGRALRAELEEIAAAYRNYHGHTLAEGDWTRALNTPAEQILREENQPARMAVLGWGSWAALHQRQFCQTIQTTWTWLEEAYGVPEQAAEFKKKITAKFSGLQLFPLLNMEPDSATGSKRAFELRAQTLIEAHPSWVPFHFWSDTPRRSQMVQNRGAHAPPLFTRLNWFSPVLPMGTTYDAPLRDSSTLCALSGTEIDQVKAIAPYSDAVLYQQLQKAKSSRPTPDEVASQFEVLRGYDTWAMLIVADAYKGDPERYEQAYTQLCYFKPDNFLNLGDYLLEHRRPDAAAKAYQKAVDHAPDRVAVSNNVRWLIDYYYERGRRKDAFAVAEMAAEAYSSRGLSTMAALLEKDGQLTQAETYLKKIEERYNQNDELITFYGRHRENKPFAEAFDQMTTKLFPRGQELADVATLSGIPRDGVVLTGMNERTQRAGLKNGDVIVTINGIRVRNQQQYRYLLQSAPSPTVQFGFWSPQNYRSVVINVPERRLGVSISDLR
ncbi:MAG: hypothetical protein QOH88_2184 [Verrucomicrobiota bacterium]|jgi:Tfp pilus assembly protein PilF